MQTLIVYILCGAAIGYVVWRLVRLIRHHSPEELCPGCDKKGCKHCDQQK